MKKYRKLAEMLTDAHSLAERQPEMVKELLYAVWLVEANWPDDENACVLLLDNEHELAEAEKICLALRDQPTEIDERTWCDDERGYRKIVWVLGQDGSGIVALMDVWHGKKI